MRVFAQTIARLMITAAACTAFGGLALAADKPAFPGAEGFGKIAQGGRGGRMMFVTNLKDSGPGSLRQCVEARKQRNCIFQVSGTIELEQSLTVQKGSGRVSILGQTAPGDGILLTIKPQKDTEKLTPLVVKNSGDVIVRHIRIRPQITKTKLDGVTVENSTRVYLDHVSAAWATDENVSTHANTTDLTVAYSIFGEGLDRHSKCALLGSDPRIPQNLSFWRNACVSNTDRNPDNNHYGGSCIEIVNNVFYNAQSEWGEVYTQFPGGTPIIFTQNLYKTGPSTSDETFAIHWKQAASISKPQIYESGNKAVALDGKKVTIVAPDTVPFLVQKPPCTPSAPAIGSAEQAYSEVHEKAGAFPRDAVDQRFMSEMGDIDFKGGGAIVAQFGKLPPMTAATPYADADLDGMADAVEANFGAKPGVADAWEDSDGDGWSNFDEFMQWLSDERVAGRYPQ